MKNVLHQKNWNQVAVHIHMEPPPVPFIKGNNDRKPDTYCVKIQLPRDTTVENSDLYKFKLPFFTTASRKIFCC